MVEFVPGISVAEALGTVGHPHERFIRAAEDFSRFYVDWYGLLLKDSALGQATVSPSLISLVSTAGGSVLAASDIVSPAQVITRTLIALVTPAAVKVLGTMTWAYQIAGAAALRIMDLLSIAPLPVEGSSVPGGADIETDGMSSSYGATLVLDNVNLTIPEGSVTALVGSSGSGESMFAMLATCLTNPNQGNACIDGVDARDITPDTPYRHVFFVFQNLQLLDISVHDNVALGVPGASGGVVWMAAGAAHTDNYLRSLLWGLGSAVGEDAHPSGGQAQRIMVTQALLVDAPVFILDGATAFTDLEAEVNVQVVLIRLVRGKTALAITHHAASIADVGQIVILDTGHIIAVDTPGELIDHPCMWCMGIPTKEH